MNGAILKNVLFEFVVLDHFAINNAFDRVKLVKLQAFLGSFLECLSRRFRIADKAMSASQLEIAKAAG